MIELVEFERQLGASIEELEQVKEQVNYDDNHVADTTVVTLPIRDVIGAGPGEGADDRLPESRRR